MGPLLLGTGIYQANILLSRLLASFLPDGSLSYLYYAQRLVEIPQGMFAIAIASAALPSLARLHGQGDHEGALSAMRYSIRLTSLVALPCAVLLAVLAEPIVSVFFGRGEFGQAQIAGTAWALAWLALGVWAVAVIQPVTRMFYAYGDTRSPVIASALNLLVFLGLSVLCAGALAHGAIALGTSAAACVQLGLLFWLLRKHAQSLGAKELIAGCGRHVLACVPMALVAYFVCWTADFSAGAGLPQVLTLLGALALGALVFVGTALLLGTEELRVVLRTLKRRQERATE
jgi:putative peptidoglycan lipid II flippase